MGKLSPKALWVQKKIQLHQAASAEKALEVENQKYQHLLDRFCLKLETFLGLFQEALTGQVQDVLDKANVFRRLPVVLPDNPERRRGYVNFEGALADCILICAQRQPAVYDPHIFRQPPSIAPYVPQIKQDLYDRIDAYQSLDRLYHLAFTNDPNNSPKHRVDALMKAMKALPIKVDEVGQLIGELLLVLKPEKPKGALSQRHGLYARPDNHANIERSPKRRNKAVRF